jgi:L-iditol 2-dehydrogenase
MKLARYIGAGRVEIVDEPAPSLPPGGLLVQTEACGLCSGELMSWYMDRKIPHVLGHEVAGRVIGSEDPRFPIGSRIFPHHHAPDPDSNLTRRGAAVHDPAWKKTKLIPGGMAERFAVPPENLADTLLVDDLRPVDAALIEPLACVMKMIRRLHLRGDEEIAVIGLGVMGLMHALVLPNVRAYELNADRIDWAKKQGVSAFHPDDARQAEVVIVCPGAKAALDLALQIAAPDPRVGLFAPLPPGEPAALDLHDLYFRDLNLVCSYSCGPEDTRAAADLLRAGKIRAEQVVSHFIELRELPQRYKEMRDGEILKPMVVFPV